MDSSLIFRLLLTATLVCAGATASVAQQEPGQDPPTQQQIPPSPDDQADDEPADQPVDEEEDGEEAPDDQPPGGQQPEGQQPAQQAPEDQAPEGQAPDQPAPGAPQEPAQQLDPAQPDDSPEPPAQPSPQDQEPIEPPPAEEETAVDEPADQDSPISDLAAETQDEKFTPLEVDEDALDSIIPVEVYPYVDWSGHFRVRSEVNVNFDLDTNGTSAVPPLIDEFVSSTDQTDVPVEEDANTIWTTNMRLRLEPRLHLTESLRLHIEADVFDNIVFGTRYDNPNFYGIVTGRDDQAPLIRVNEGYGEVEGFFGVLRAGRVDDHWGLGIFANDGDCLDCDVESPIDRISLTSQIWREAGLYARLSVDFPNEGATTDPLLFGEQPYDIGQADDASQYTVSLFRGEAIRNDRELGEATVEVGDKPVFNGGVYFTYRNQPGFFSPDPTLGTSAGEAEQLDQGLLVYRGLTLYVPDLWFEMLYMPQEDRFVRVGLEAVGIFGSISNETREPVGVTEDGQAINCFDETTRQNNEAACTTQGIGEDRTDVSRDITEFGVALESEFYLGGPVRFGLNGGYASGGPEANWGIETDPSGNVAPGSGGLDFYRFHPNYHVDLILFREVLGTVTNAYYGNPWAQVRFLESPGVSRMELQLDAIVSAAANPTGTPSAVLEDGEATGGNRWLGLEIDAGLRYLEFGNFSAELEGGILFPFAGLGARTGGRRLIQVGDAPAEYGTDIDPSLAWTVQGNLLWAF